MRRKTINFLVTLILGLLCFSSNAETYHRIEFEGNSYEYNSLIRTILYAGVDSDGKLETYDRFTIAPRADAIELFIFDGYSKTIKILGISRDTMTSVKRFTMDGTDRGSCTTHLGYAYTFGDGGRISCENLVEAVSDLLGGIPIHEYVITNKGGIEQGNALVGGVSVVVPNDDLKEKYPEMTEGATVALDETNVRDFIRFRDIMLPFTNSGRMAREKAYTVAFTEKLKELVIQKTNSVWNEIQSAGDYIQTSITRNQYLRIADELASYTFSPEDYYQLGGKNKTGDSYDEVWLDPVDVSKLCLELFYHRPV